MEKITYAWLKERGACKDQLKLFRKYYPKGIDVCWACFKEAQQKGLTVCWLPQWLGWKQQGILTNYVYRVSSTDNIEYLMRPRGLKLLEKYLKQWVPEED